MRGTIPIFLSSSEIEKFHLSVNKKTDTECWEWNGPFRSAKDKYGCFYVSNRGRYRPNRIAFFIATGIDPGKIMVCHTCDNPPCCNPSHLFLGDAKTNALDQTKKGRRNIGSAVFNAKVNETQVQEIRHLYKSGQFSLSMISRQFGITKSDVSRIVQNRIWRHVELCPIQFGTRVLDSEVRRGALHGGSKLTEKEVLEIRKRHHQKLASQEQLAMEFGVAVTNISDIITRKIWKHIPEEDPNFRICKYCRADSPITPEIVLRIRETVTGKYGEVRNLAKMFGVSSYAISCIIHRKTWKHI